MTERRPRVHGCVASPRLPVSTSTSQSGAVLLPPTDKELRTLIAETVEEPDQMGFMPTTIRMVEHSVKS